MPITNQISTAGAVSAERAAGTSSARLAGHHLDADKAGPPRFIKGLMSIGSAFRKSLDKLKLSVDNAMERRADAKIRKAQERNDRRVGKMLQILARPHDPSQTRSNRLAIAGELTGLQDNMHPALKLEDELYRSARAKVGSMPRHERLALEHGLSEGHERVGNAAALQAIQLGLAHGKVAAMPGSSQDKAGALLADPVLFRQLHAKAKEEFASENLDFLSDLQALRQESNPKKAAEMQAAILDTYFTKSDGKVGADDGKKEVNLSADRSAAVREAFASGSDDRIRKNLDLAGADVVQLVKTDTAARYLQQHGLN